MDRPGAAGGLDSSADSSQHSHVRRRIHADHLLPSPARATASPNLLRGQCFPVLQELILHACTYPRLNRRSKIQAHLIAVIVDQLGMVRAIPLQLPSPADPRAARVAEALQRDPSEQRSLEAVCKQAGASKRTIERLFQVGDAFVAGKVAAATPIDAVAAVACRRGEDHACRPGGGLQHTQRVHRHVPQDSGNHASPIL